TPIVAELEILAVKVLCFDIWCSFADGQETHLVKRWCNDHAKGATGGFVPFVFHVAIFLGNALKRRLGLLRQLGGFGQTVAPRLLGPILEVLRQKIICRSLEAPISMVLDDIAQHFLACSTEFVGIELEQLVPYWVTVVRDIAKFLEDHFAHGL